MVSQQLSVTRILRFVSLSIFFSLSMSSLYAETGAVCNRLGKEKSPYLRQHEANPVCWYPWGEEAFKAARDQNKPIFLSIGYSTCYWCHVMEKDSFEHEDVAAILNKHFISIKVDREERPDIDQIYMDAVQAMRGRGGWPLSVMLTPYLRPFWGGTFFYRDQFKKILNTGYSQWSQNPSKARQLATRIKKALEARGPRQEIPVSEGLLFNAVDAYRQRFDAVYGGFGRAPKFPPVPKLRFLLRFYRRTRDESVKEMLTTTLRAMAAGGMYDHLGGGFARYSTDQKWLIPHFEKMLYDNAQLATLYLEAGQILGEPLYFKVAEETLQYVERVMTSKEGGFYSAQDAGEVGKEGEYYVWSYKEIKSALSQREFLALSRVFDITEEGNFEHAVVLALKEGQEWSARFTSEVRTARRKLLGLRETREAPHLDDKSLAAWNAMMISAFARGAEVFPEKGYRAQALKAAMFFRAKFYKEGKLLRRYREGESRFDGTLEDYVFAIEAFLDVYRISQEEEWLRLAMKLQEVQDRLFWDSEEGGYFFTTAEEVFIRKKDYFDGSIPAAQARAVGNLQRLYSYYAEPALRDRLLTLCSLYSSMVERSPLASGQILDALTVQLSPLRQLVVVEGTAGDSAEEMLRAVRSKLIPGLTIARLRVNQTSDIPLMKGKKSLGNKTTFYVCEDHVCKAPITSARDALQALLVVEPLKRNASVAE